jgi:hypothetical protein
MECSLTFIFGIALNVTKKIDLLKKYLSDYDDLKIIVVYFDDFNDNLSKSL